MTTLLNSRDIAALNRARAVLKRLEEGAWRRSLSHYDPLAPVTAWDLGRLSEAACVADDAILHVLATARANCNVKMSDAQLFGAAPVEEPDQEEPEAPHPAAEASHEPEGDRADAAPPEAPAEQDGLPDAPQDGHAPPGTRRGRVRAV